MTDPHHAQQDEDGATAPESTHQTASGMPRRDFLELVAGSTVGGALATQANFLGVLDGESLARLSDVLQDDTLERVWKNPPQNAGLWVVWHWMNANVTKEGLTRDLEEMAAAGIRNPCMFSIGARSATNTVVDVPADPLSEHWWDLVRHAMAECTRLGMTMAMQICDGWAAAGGSWITPELSMQKVVWSEQTVTGGQAPQPLARPDTGANAPAEGGGFGGAAPAGAAPTRAQLAVRAAREYYRDIAVFAYPVPDGWGETSETRRARVSSTLPVTDPAKLSSATNTATVIDTEQSGHIDFTFDQPFTLRALTVRSGAPAPPPRPAGAPGGGPGGGGGGGSARAGLNLASHSFEVHVSTDGTTFRKLTTLAPMQGGWQTSELSLTHSVPETTAKVFRLVHVPRDVYPYDEQMANATRPTDNNRLRVANIVLSSAPAIHHAQGKTAQTWGLSRTMTERDAPAAVAVPLASIVDLTARLRSDGTVDWTAPAGRIWRVVRIGHTGTGKTNSPAGAAEGLECDKLNPAAARAQFDGWFGEALRRGGDAAKAALKTLNIDSWECGSQNWSVVLPEEFRKRRGYEMGKYLLTLAGVPVENGDVTERFLRDFRATLGEATVDNFWKVTQALAKEHGCQVSVETTGPVYPGDGLAHYRYSDVPTGEFWVGAFNNWKILDIMESVSAARIWGQNIAMTESFTGGGTWTEHPGNIKPIGDLHYAKGVNRFMLHLWGQQAFPDRYPGIAGSAGTQFNYHQTWWKDGHAFFDYLRRCQALLQSGRAVVDVAYYTGEELPRRALVRPEDGTTHVMDPVLPPSYSFDCVNRDMLLSAAKVVNGRLAFPSGASYRVLVLRNEDFMSLEMAGKIGEFVRAGLVVVGRKPVKTPGLSGGPTRDAQLRALVQPLWGAIDGKSVTDQRVGAGRVVWGKPLAQVLTEAGVQPDLRLGTLVDAATGAPFVAPKRGPRYNPTSKLGPERFGGGIQWTHRQLDSQHLYFLTNQESAALRTEVTFRVTGMVPERWDAESGRITRIAQWREERGATVIPLDFAAAESCFVVFRRTATAMDPVTTVDGASALPLEVAGRATTAFTARAGEWRARTKSGRRLTARVAKVNEPVTIEGPWSVTMTPPSGAAKTVNLPLGTWTTHTDPDVKFFSGTAAYRTDFTWTALQAGSARRLVLDLGEVRDIARVSLNGKALGVRWTAPFTVDITDAIQPGTNRLEIAVTNTWRNRLIGDVGKRGAERRSWLHNFNEGSLTEATMTPAGLVGPVRIVTLEQVTLASASD